MGGEGMCVVCTVSCVCICLPLSMATDKRYQTASCTMSMGEYEASVI